MLLAIEAGMGHSDDLLRDHPLMERMSDADRRLATTLVLGVLRWQIHLDQETRKFLFKPKVKFDAAVLIALRVGAFQLLHLDRIPARAAIDESVALTKRSGYASASGLVNAVLRKMADAAKTRGSAGATTAEGRLSQAVAAHPAWMVERWTKYFGKETASAICLHDQGPPEAAVRLSSADVQDELAQAGAKLVAGKLLTMARVVESGAVMGTEAFRENRVRFQDEGSQLVGEMAAALTARIESERARILDCCAAPGGKTLILAERNPAAHIVACEASQPRLKQLRDRLGSLGERVECKLADATELGFDQEFDLALADVPCSGTGTLSRNPEIRHRLQPEDLARQAERQRAILSSALRAVRPGGCVLYSTCSLEPEENEDVVRTVSKEMGNTRIVELGPVLERLADGGILMEDAAGRLRCALSPEGFLRLTPGTFATDGFFIAIIEKVTHPASQPGSANTVIWS